MASLNKVILVGRLTRDPEVRNTTSGLKVAEFSIAVDRPYGKNENGEKKTDFFRCKAWRQRADFVEQYVAKGRLVMVEGRIELNEYTDREGQKRFSTDISVDNVEALDSNRDRPGDAAPASSNEGAGRNGGGNSRGDGDGGNGYFADDEPAPARAPQRPAAAAQPAPARPAARPAPAEAAPATARKPAPAATYDDDFDDSDPFADE